MPTRREFLQMSAAAGLTLSAASPLFGQLDDKRTANGAPGFGLARFVATKLFDGKRCWCHPRTGIIPNAGKNGNPRIVMTMNTLTLSGSDVFQAMYGLYSDDIGQKWSEPVELSDMAVRHETIDGQERPVAASDFTPRWHAKSGKLLGTGHTVVYTPEWKVTNPRPRHTAYSVYDAEKNTWEKWKKLGMPAGDKYGDCGAGCTQRYDLDDGTILLPMYFRPPGKNSRVIVARCSFDGKTLKFEKHGNELSIDDNTRGLHEPSLTRFNGIYYLTIRNDKRGFVTYSEDGLNFQPMREWRFDDGSELGNYNTQQHWVTHSDGLFLAYTRRGAENDHVFRHRAPLFMAQVDPKKMQVIRETESILVPERGARLGNFGVTDVSPAHTLVTVAEWMQPEGVEKHGSDGSVYAARIRWNRPNEFFKV